MIHELAEEYYARPEDPLHGSGTREDPYTPNLVGNPQNLSRALAKRTGVFETGGGVGFEHERHPYVQNWKSIYGLEEERKLAPPYKGMTKGVEESGLGAPALGGVFQAVFNDPELNKKLTPQQKFQVGRLLGTMFGKEETHPGNTFGHKRDLVHALMIANMLKLGTISVRELNESPTASTFQKQKIQESTRVVTTNIVGEGAPNYPPGYGPGLLPPDIGKGEKIRLEREIANFEKWVRATGELERVSKDTPSIDDLKTQVRSRLEAFLKGKV